MYLSFVCFYSKGFSYRRLLNKYSIELPIARYETYLYWPLNNDRGQTSIKRHSWFTSKTLFMFTLGFVNGIKAQKMATINLHGPKSIYLFSLTLIFRTFRFTGIAWILQTLCLYCLYFVTFTMYPGVSCTKFVQRKQWLMILINL